MLNIANHPRASQGLQMGVIMFCHYKPEFLHQEKKKPCSPPTHTLYLHLFPTWYHFLRQPICRTWYSKSPKIIQQTVFFLFKKFVVPYTKPPVSLTGIFPIIVQMGVIMFCHYKAEFLHHEKKKHAQHLPIHYTFAYLVLGTIFEDKADKCDVGHGIAKVTCCRLKRPHASNTLPMRATGNKGR